MGTARMGSDPRRSVVDARNQAHDVKNLFIVDGSSFTTCSSVNPTSTIGALALRAADGIWERRQEWS
jgi:choline dehydrogenase-like flavoprotein